MVVWYIICYRIAFKAAKFLHLALHTILTTDKQKHTKTYLFSFLFTISRILCRNPQSSVIRPLFNFFSFLVKTKTKQNNSHSHIPL